MSSGSDPEMPENEFLLQFDPGPYPLASGVELGILEVVWGLRLGSFNPGTLLCDQLAGSLHTVRQGDGRLYLDPPCERIENHARSLHPDGQD
jgi:hypothetical protein